MKKVLALFAFVMICCINISLAQTTENKVTAAPDTEQSVSKSNAPKACCASHGATKTEANTVSVGGVKTASTTHEHAGKMCDPANCTEAQKKQCAGAKGKGCCAGSAAKTEEKTSTPTP